MLDLPYYRLELDDYAAAAFTSFSEDYYGTLDDILRLMDALENDEDLCKSQQALLTAFHSFEQGDTAVQHPVAYQNVPLLTEAKVLYQEKRQYRDISWTHWNTWQWPYYLRGEEVIADHLWLQCEKKFCRCMNARFRNLEYRSSHSHDWKPLGDMLWGFPEMIVYRPPLLWNRLAVIEKQFDALPELQADVVAFANNPDPDFSRICDDIFGDG